MTRIAAETTVGRKTRSRSEELSLEGLREFTLDGDPQIAAAATTALRCVEDADADPRLMLLVVEAAVEGQFDALPGAMGATA